ncbi:hypothetical protein GCM10022377_26830 [Zhihengliuella alba]|uniref:Uncharacterized protein n=1 Tax=Zhihengliuella alba TaxID=547018 RepID=A0ABP7DZ55_9MICC
MLVGGALVGLSSIGPLRDYAAVCWIAAGVLFLAAAAAAAYRYGHDRPFLDARQSGQGRLRKPRSTGSSGGAA